MALTTLKNWLQRRGVQIVLLVLGMVILIQSGILLANRDAETKSKDWLRPLGIDVSRSMPQCEFTTNLELASEPEKRLLEQLREIRCREAHHIGIMKFFYFKYYTAITMSSILGVLAAITLFFISKKGWAATDDRLVAIFIVATAAAAYFYAFPTVFRQTENISENKTLYLQYKALENEVNSFFATKEDISANIKDTKQFVHYVDQRMNTLHNIAVGFDYTKIPKNVLETVPNSNTGTQNANVP